MKKCGLVVAFFACGIAVCAISFAMMRHENQRDHLRTKEIHFSYARYPEPQPGPVPEGATLGDVYFSRHPEYRHELSERFVRDMFDTLRKEKSVQKVFAALSPSFCESAQGYAKSILMGEIRGVEFAVDRQPKDANPVKGTIIVRSSSERRADAIAREYVEFLRRLSEDETRERIVKMTMTYNSDFHKKKRELKIIGKKLSRNGVGDSDRQAAQKDIEELEDEMKKIKAEWQERSEAYRKTMGGVLVFLDGE